MSDASPDPAPEPETTDAEIRLILKEGFFSQAVLGLVGMTFLTDFALKLGATNLFIGLIPAIGGITQILLLVSVYLVEIFRTRRKITVYFQILSRINVVFLALIPIFFTGPIGLWVMILALLFHDSFAAVARGSWNSLVRDLIPQNKMGAIYSRRFQYMNVGGAAAALAGGYYIDQWTRFYPDHAINGYSLLFFAAFWLAVYQISFMSRVPERPLPLEANRPTFWEVLAGPVQDPNFRKLLVFLGTWNFAFSLAYPFFVVYMIQRLQLGLLVIICFQTVGQVLYLTFIPTAGRISDRFGNKPVLAFCVPLFILCLLLWTFTTFPEKHRFTLPLLGIIYVFVGISTAGVNLSSWNIGLKLSPRGKATAYLAAVSLVNSITSGISPILGGLFSDFFKYRQLTLNLHWISPVKDVEVQTFSLEYWDFFFALAFLIGLFSLYRLKQVTEGTEIRNRKILVEFWHDARNTLFEPIFTLGRLPAAFRFGATLKNGGETPAGPG